MAAHKIAVLVAGSWGTALASVLADNGHDVYLWSRHEKQAKEINEKRENSQYLPGVRLPEHLRATSSLEEAVSGADMVVIVAPSSAMGEVTSRMSPYVGEKTVIVHASKGFEEGTMRRMTEVILGHLPATYHSQVAVLSGPSHAEEVVRKCPTTVVVAAFKRETAEFVQQLFINSYFRVYTHPDVIGVEVGGALKNIIAIGSGLSDGLGFGDNAKAALLTRGLAEITRLGTAMGADPLTFSGLSGVGDLVVTCTSRHSRNWKAGYMLAQGKSMQEVLETMGMVVEGVKTTRSAYQLAHRYGVEMPITTQLYEVLFHDKDPRTAVEELMRRDRTREIEQWEVKRALDWT